MTARGPHCPRCPSLLEPVPHQSGADGSLRWSCPAHGEVPPLWRPQEASYDELSAHLLATEGLPTYLPWPLRPGWAVTDLARVGDPGRSRATLTGCAGPSDADGPVDVTVVTEEAGTGLGARAAGISAAAARPDLSLPPQARLRIGTHAVPLWMVSTLEPGEHPLPGPDGAVAEQDRAVVVGEALGRWLWVVLRPASALLLLREDWLLRDVSGLGPALLDVPFGDAPPAW